MPSMTPVIAKEFQMKESEVLEGGLETKNLDAGSTSKHQGGYSGDENERRDATYVDKHNLFGLFHAMIASVVTYSPPCPLDYLTEFLQKIKAESPPGRPCYDIRKFFNPDTDKEQIEDIDWRCPEFPYPHPEYRRYITEASHDQSEHCSITAFVTALKRLVFKKEES
jgi:hypothetical protein